MSFTKSKSRVSSETWSYLLATSSSHVLPKFYFKWGEPEDRKEILTKETQQGRRQSLICVSDLWGSWKRASGAPWPERALSFSWVDSARFCFPWGAFHIPCTSISTTQGVPCNLGSSFIDAVTRQPGSWQFLFLITPPFWLNCDTLHNYENLFPKVTCFSTFLTVQP